MTYNSTGLAMEKQQFINDMIESYAPDVIFMQETWLLNTRINSVLSNIHDNYMANGVSAVPDDELLVGRPYGGVAIMWKRSLARVAAFKRVPGTNRACALELKLDNQKFLLVNMYMPVDNHRKHHVDGPFLDTMDCLELFMEGSLSDNIIVGGDMNLDLNRGNAHDIYFKDFMERYDLINTFNLPNADVGYTYYDIENGGRSCIDHLNVHRSLCGVVKAVSRCDLALNPSKHLPVLVDLDISYDTEVRVNREESQAPLPISWCKVNDKHIMDYHQRQNSYLKNIKQYEILKCRDTLCKSQNHQKEIDDMCADLIDCCLKSDCAFPRIQKKKVRRPRWTEEVKPYRDDALWWHNLWIHNGRPSNGIIFDNMKESKRQYSYANRRNKRKDSQKRKERMVEAISRNCSRDFFKEVKKLNPKTRNAPTIDGKAEPPEIAEVFKVKYCELFNSVPSDVGIMNRISDYISRNINNIQTDHLIEVTEVSKAIDHLKTRKGDGDKGIMSDHIILSSDLFKDHLTALFQAIVIHGHQPKDLLLGTISSIPKDNKGNLCQSSNYRGITLCSSISKVLDIVVLHKYSKILLTSDLQYAFKKQHSTAMCSLVLKEVINYYLNNNSDVYSCFIDASKVFDRVRHDKLFEILVDRGMPAIIIRMMLDLYQRQVMRTVWENHYSTQFGTSNGIRQGGVISPVFYCLYVDILLKSLERDSVGCRLGKHFYGAIGYADDLTLCAPSVSGLRRMIKTCEEFGRDFSVVYNPTKTVCVCFSRSKNVIKPSVHLNGEELSWVSEVKHLGNYLESGLRETKEIRMKKSDLIQRTNSVLLSFCNGNIDVIRTVFKSQCTHFYGAESWQFTDRSFPDFQTTWNRCVRRL